VQPTINRVKPENEPPGSQDGEKKQPLDHDYCTKEVNKQSEDFLQVIEPAQRG